MRAGGGDLLAVFILGNTVVVRTDRIRVQKLPQDVEKALSSFPLMARGMVYFGRCVTERAPEVGAFSVCELILARRS